MRTANPLLHTPKRPLPKHVAIIGAGTIGPDIGYYLKSALPQIRLTLVDVAQPALDKALQRCQDYARKAVARGKMSEALAAAVNANITGTLDYATLADCDWVIEAATENLSLKRRIFAQLESVVSPQALITSNTSSLPAERIFSELKHPPRATVTHFFAPAWRNPAVEVIDWDKTDPDVIDYLRWVFCVTGKVPLVTADAACFMLDRVFDNWCNEAAMLLGRVTAAEVDSTAVEFVQAGPFFVLNLAHGNPIITETNTLQAEEEGEHYRPATIFRSVDTWVTVPPGKRIEVAPETAAAARDRLLGVLF
ncbi:MAG: 3-hydroxyacyl-CoA dehydrogenase family protein [Proteobacteria bacterium]|nr:3-hydroxyacyl-CoA dehydrogenase family protein [Pseudomonadota bacterium]